MARTHEALLKAEKEGRKKYLEPVNQPQKAFASAVLREEMAGPTPEWCKEIKTRLNTQSADDTIKAIMFTGSKSGSGCSSTAAGFALSLAEDFEHKVLLVDVNLRDPGIHKFFEDPDTTGLFEVLQENHSVIVSEAPERLFVITCNGDHKEDPQDFFGTHRFEAFLKKMCKEFDYVILDGPPVISGPEIQSIVSNVDGVILMLESEKARQQLALKVKQKIETAGGKFLGVVINQRKHYIPNWIYRRL